MEAVILVLIVIFWARYRITQSRGVVMLDKSISKTDSRTIDKEY